MPGVKESYVTFVWLFLLILFLVVEILTVGLTCIWAAGGALIALILSVLKVSFAVQVVAFFTVTFVLLLFTRPFAAKYINTRREKTNYERMIGKLIRITERVDNLGQTGMAVVDGQEWTVRSEEDTIVLEPGMVAEVVHISGVKLIVRKHKEE